MPRLNRHTARVCRQLFTQQFRQKILPQLLGVVAKSLATGAWPSSCSPAYLLDIHRSTVELAMQMPAVATRTGTKAERELEDAERELRNWKRRRSIARAKVAKYSRMVRYRRKAVAK